MIFVAYTTSQRVSSNCGEILKQTADFNPEDKISGFKVFSNNYFCAIELNDSILAADYLDKIRAEAIIFMSQHRSKASIESFTVHSEGNWSEDAQLGGTGKQLGVASPLLMTKTLALISKNNLDKKIQVTYEATHHGPLLKTPSFFVEWGGAEELLTTKPLQILVNSIKDSIEDQNSPHYDNIVVGIGGGHYPAKFTRLGIEGKYAFSHIMPRYHIEVDMLEQAFERSAPKAEVGVIESKGIKAAERELVIKKLNELGFDHVKV